MRKGLPQRLARVEQQVAQKEVVYLPAPPAPAPEGGVLAGELAAAFGRMAQFYRQQYQLSAQEAVARAGETHPLYEEQVLHGPPDQVSWLGLENLAQRDPELAQRRWEEVKAAAREELASGHRAARSLEAGEMDCWQRARFLALRSELTEAWRPRDGLEQQLVDQLAEARTLLLTWQEALVNWTVLANQTIGRTVREKCPHQPPKVSVAETVEQAARMVERFQRMYLRTLSAETVAPGSQRVVVRRAGQVNIAQQQVNLAAVPGQTARIAPTSPPLPDS